MDQQHSLAIAGTALDPEQYALFVIPPLPKVGVVENLLVRVLGEAAFSLLDT